MVSRLDDLPAMLIRARIAQQLTHAQLAERLEVKSQQIQRWEEDDDHSAAFWRLIDVAEALGLAFSISAPLPDAPGETDSQWPERKRRAG